MYSLSRLLMSHSNMRKKKKKKCGTKTNTQMPKQCRMSLAGTGWVLLTSLLELHKHHPPLLCDLVVLSCRLWKNYLLAWLPGLSADGSTCNKEVKCYRYIKSYFRPKYINKANQKFSSRTSVWHGAFLRIFACGCSFSLGIRLSLEISCVSVT